MNATGGGAPPGLRPASGQYEPLIRDGGFYFDLFIDGDEMTWDEYFGLSTPDAEVTNGA